MVYMRIQYMCKVPKGLENFVSINKFPKLEQRRRMMSPFSYLLPLPGKGSRVGFRTLKIYFMDLLTRLTARTEKPHCIQPSLIFHVLQNLTVYAQICLYFYSKTNQMHLLTYLFTYLLTYLLTPWSRVLLEKLTGLQLVKKFPAFYGTRRFITALISALQLSLS